MPDWSWQLLYSFYQGKVNAFCLFFAAEFSNYQPPANAKQASRQQDATQFNNWPPPSHSLSRRLPTLFQPWNCARVLQWLAAVRTAQPVRGSGTPFLRLLLFGDGRWPIWCQELPDLGQEKNRCGFFNSRHGRNNHIPHNQIVSARQRPCPHFFRISPSSGMSYGDERPDAGCVTLNSLSRIP